MLINTSVSIVDEKVISFPMSKFWRDNWFLNQVDKLDKSLMINTKKLLCVNDDSDFRKISFI